MDEVRAEPGPVVRWIHRRRPILTFALAAAALAHAIVSRHPPTDLLAPRGDRLAWLAWALMIAGVGIRVWGSGNLRKNEEITSTGVYRMVRHPLYVGSLAMFLAFFITVGNPWIGLGLFVAMVALVYYPTMLAEEAHLKRLFPDAVEEHRRLSRLVPNPLRLPDALETDRFTVETAYRNLGLRSLWFLLALPALLRLLQLLHEGR